MEALNPINNFKAMSTKKKVATVAGAVLTTAAVASVPLAYLKGKKVGEEQFLKALGTGYKKVSSSILEQFNKIKEAVFKPKTQEAAQETAQATVEKTGEAVTEKTGEAVVEKTQDSIEVAVQKAAAETGAGIVNHHGAKTARRVVGKVQVEKI